jgi:RNA polymerase sigma-70 factor, ECF subfamily
LPPVRLWKNTARMDNVNRDVDRLIEQACSGDLEAQQALLMQHRDRLRRMVAVRLDPRLAPRVDPSDVVQEALAAAAQLLSAYLRERPVPFYPWLRRLAWERLVKLHRQHIGTEKRSVTREVILELPDGSVDVLARIVAGKETNPSDQAVRKELQSRIRSALNELGERDREVLILRYLEQLSVLEIATVVGCTPGAIKVRHLRALERLRVLLGEEEL